MIEVHTFQYAARITTALEKFVRPSLAAMRQMKQSLYEAASMSECMHGMDEVTRGVDLCIKGLERREREMETALQDFEVSEGLVPVRPVGAHIPGGR